MQLLEAEEQERRDGLCCAPIGGSLGASEQEQQEEEEEEEDEQESDEFLLYEELRWIEASSKDLSRDCMGDSCDLSKMLEGEQELAASAAACAAAAAEAAEEEEQLQVSELSYLLAADCEPQSDALFGYESQTAACNSATLLDASFGAQQAHTSPSGNLFGASFAQQSSAKAHSLASTSNSSSGSSLGSSSGASSGDAASQRSSSTLSSASSAATSNTGNTRPQERAPKRASSSHYKRRTANARERVRMREINQAFEKLKQVVPVELVQQQQQQQQMLASSPRGAHRTASEADDSDHTSSQHSSESSSSSSFKLTKINTLRLAISYIAKLNTLLQQQQQEHSCAQLAAAAAAEPQLEQRTPGRRRPRVHKRPQATSAASVRRDKRLKGDERLKADGRLKEAAERVPGEQERPAPSSLAPSPAAQERLQAQPVQSAQSPHTVHTAHTVHTVHAPAAHQSQCVPARFIALQAQSRCAPAEQASVQHARLLQPAGCHAHPLAHTHPPAAQPQQQLLIAQPARPGLQSAGGFVTPVTVAILGIAPSQLGLPAGSQQQPAGHAPAIQLIGLQPQQQSVGQQQQQQPGQQQPPRQQQTQMVLALNELGGVSVLRLASQNSGQFAGGQQQQLVAAGNQLQQYACERTAPSGQPQGAPAEAAPPQGADAAHLGAKMMIYHRNVIQGQQKQPDQAATHIYHQMQAQNYQALDQQQQHNLQAQNQQQQQHNQQQQQNLQQPETKQDSNNINELFSNLATSIQPNSGQLQAQSGNQVQQKQKQQHQATSSTSTSSSSSSSSQVQQQQTQLKQSQTPKLNELSSQQQASAQDPFASPQSNPLQQQQQQLTKRIYRFHNYDGSTIINSKLISNNAAQKCTSSSSNQQQQRQSDYECSR